jgi:GTP1/Obg family GTP-binding protein
MFVNTIFQAGDCIRRVYEKKCIQLRHEESRGASSEVIDKRRARIKDLHSRVRVAIEAVDSVSKRIQRLRDEELQPQLMELIQG